MICLKDNTMILYIDKALSEREMKKVKTHLSGCPKCRVNLERMENNLQMVMQKMDLLEPGQMPAADFVPPGKAREKFKRPNPFEYWKWNFGLKPAYLVMMVLVISLLVVVNPFSGPVKGGPSPSDAKGLFAIHSIKMEDQPAQTYIIKEQETKTTLIWVEKI